MVEVVRVLRVIEYVGPRGWVEKCMEARVVKGTKTIGANCYIKEAVVGEYPEILTIEVPSVPPSKPEIG